MTSNTHQPFSTSDSSNLDDSGFLNHETTSNSAESDYADNNPPEMNSHNTEEVSQNSADPHTDIDDERQNRMMRRIPQ